MIFSTVLDRGVRWGLLYCLYNGEEHGGLQPRGRAADRPDPPGRGPDLLQLRGLAHRAALHRGRAVVRSSACRVVP